MHHLEAEAIDEERTDCLTFLAACSSALEASSPKACRILVIPFHLLLGNAPVSALLSIPPGVSPFQLEAAMQTPPASAIRVPEPSPQSSGNTTRLTRESPLPHQSPTPKWLWMSPPFQAEGGVTPP